MPRLARLDAPGILHHVIIPGIERKNIFRDKTDKENLVDRLSQLIPETGTYCYAWTLLSNHAGIDMSRRPELVGGGMVRSLGGWSEVRKMRSKGMERILGDSDFVLSILSQAKEKFERRYELKRYGYDINRVAERVAGIFGIDEGEIFRKGRQKKRSDARGLFCYWCIRQLGLTQADLARKLEMTVSGIGYAVRRGEAIAARERYKTI